MSVVHRGVLISAACALFLGIASLVYSPNLASAGGLEILEQSNRAVALSANIMRGMATLEDAIDFGSIGFGVLGEEAATSLGLLPGSADGR